MVKAEIGIVCDYESGKTLDRGYRYYKVIQMIGYDEMEYGGVGFRFGQYRYNTKKRSWDWVNAPMIASVDEWKELYEKFEENKWDTIALIGAGRKI